MKTSQEFTVEVRRGGLLLSVIGSYAGLFDATRAALDAAERTARGPGPAGVQLLVAISTGRETVLEIKVVTGRRLDD